MTKFGFIDMLMLKLLFIGKLRCRSSAVATVLFEYIHNLLEISLSFQKLSLDYLKAVDNVGLTILFLPCFKQ